MNSELYLRGDIVWGEAHSVIDTSMQLGKRPYLIVSNNQNNQYSTIYTAIPLTSKEKKILPTHHHIFINGIQNTILVEQITCISKGNISGYIDTIEDEDLQKVEEKIKIQLGLKGV